MRSSVLNLVEEHTQSVGHEDEPRDTPLVEERDTPVVGVRRRANGYDGWVAVGLARRSYTGGTHAAGRARRSVGTSTSGTRLPNGPKISHSESTKVSAVFAMQTSPSAKGCVSHPH